MFFFSFSNDSTFGEAKGTQKIAEKTPMDGLFGLFLTKISHLECEVPPRHKIFNLSLQIFPQLNRIISRDGIWQVLSAMTIGVASSFLN